jgi:CIC family chloride channel protein
MQGAFFLLLLGILKMVAASFTVGSGGSAGVFAPTLAIGSLIGGAYGKAVQYVLDDPSIQPGAFALVGMGTLYGGIAHAPLGALVMVCELAGSYDLLVPLMLGAGIAFVTMRQATLYPSQPTSQHESPAHPPRVLDVLKRMTVAEVMIADRPFASFSPGTPVTEVMKRVYDASWQDVFPVVDDTGKLVGMITPELLRLLWAEREMEPWVLAVDAMQPPVNVRPSDDLRLASERMLTHGLRELLVVEDGTIRGFIDEAEIGQIYLDRMQD